MDNKTLRKYQFQSKPLNDREVVDDWAESLATFHAYYHKVIACLQENKRRPRADKQLSSSKYPQDRLVSLLMRMKAELQLLFQDIDGLALLASDKGFTKRLSMHAKSLTQLNRQAFLLLTDQFPN